MKLAFIGASHWHLPLYLEPALAMPGVAGVVCPVGDAYANAGALPVQIPVS